MFIKTPTYRSLSNIENKRLTEDNNLYTFLSSSVFFLELLTGAFNLYDIFRVGELEKPLSVFDISKKNSMKLQETKSYKNNFTNKKHTKGPKRNIKVIHSYKRGIKYENK